MYCKYCGSPIPDGANFCPSCGRSTDAASTQRSTMNRSTVTLFSTHLITIMDLNHSGWIIVFGLGLYVMIFGILLMLVGAVWGLVVTILDHRES